VPSDLRRPTESDVWEYVNTIDGKGDGLLSRVTEATRHDFDGNHLNKPCP
jgi:hypothetical protein